MYKTYMLMAAFLALVFTGTGLARETPGDVEVVAQGEAADKNGALLAAKRSAVEEGLGVVIVSETEVKNFEVKKDEIISRAMGAVKKYEILEDKQLPDQTREVKIRAVVSLASIQKDLMALKILMESMDKPRVMVLVEEKIGAARTTNCETQITDRLLELGFNMVDPAAVAALLKSSDDLISRAVAGDKSAVVKIGAQNGAEVILVGNVRVSSGADVYEMKSGQADISVQAISCADGKVLASQNAHAAAVHASLEAAQAAAVQKASKKLVDNTKQGQVVTSLFDKIVGAWQDMANNGIPVRLKVANVTSVAAYNSLKTFVESADSHVAGVTGRGWTRPSCELEALYKGSTESLATALDGKDLPEGGKLEVVSLSSGVISLKVVK